MNEREDATAHCCADCGVEGGASLKVCKSVYASQVLQRYLPEEALG
jgi:hypothetical protein